MLSPTFSVGTPTLFNTVSKRFDMGVFSGYFR